MLWTCGIVLTSGKQQQVELTSATSCFVAGSSTGGKVDLGQEELSHFPF